MRLFDVRCVRAVVTGAASGLGFAMAEVLAECGAQVTLADIDGSCSRSRPASLASYGGNPVSPVCPSSRADSLSR